MEEYLMKKRWQDNLDYYKKLCKKYPMYAMNYKAFTLYIKDCELHNEPNASFNVFIEGDISKPYIQIIKREKKLKRICGKN